MRYAFSCEQEMRLEMDCLIREWMRLLHEQLVHTREMFTKFVAISRVVNGSNASDGFETKVPGADNAYRQALAGLEEHVVPTLGEDMYTAFREDIVKKDSNTIWLGRDVYTFMCMLTQRCQVHGSLSGARCRNMCTAKRFANPQSNFSIYKLPNSRVALYAREKCLDSVCVIPRMLVGGASEKKPSKMMLAARNMLRAKGVRHPFNLQDVSLATRVWGTFGGVEDVSLGATHSFEQFEPPFC